MKTFLKQIYREHQETFECPPPHKVVAFFKRLTGFLFAEYSTVECPTPEAVEAEYHNIKAILKGLLDHGAESKTKDTSKMASVFMSKLPSIKKQVEEDIDAIYKGDPATKSKTEIIRTYPGFYAMMAYRTAHTFHENGCKLMARTVSEHAHSYTGIDIHPGAQIGSRFCIDHGTGIVIGETSIIGNNVKIYQGVTLGALSVKKEDAGVKRHPTIQDNVVIYANATILGGNTVIEKNCTIGGNVWITKSVAADTTITYSPDSKTKTA